MSSRPPFRPIIILLILLTLGLAIGTSTAATVGPGGVGTTLTLWVKSDEGVTLSGTRVSQWDDAFSNGHTFARDVSTGGPVFFDGTADSTFNFNPYLDFNGSSSRLADYNLGGVGTSQAQTLLAIVRHNGAAQYLFSLRSADNSVTDLSIYNVKLHSLNRSIPFTTGTLPTSNATIMIGGRDNDSGLDGSMDGLFNGAVEPNGSFFNNSDNNFSLDTAKIGTYGPGFHYQGMIAEIVYFDRKITDAELEKVMSYLGIRYGITLDPSGNYVDSAGTILWNSSINGTYHYDVAGIARDDAGSLNQPKSISNNNDALVIIDGGTLGADSSALIWGNNNGSTGSFSVLAGGYTHLPRIWMVNETGTIGNVTVSVPSSTGATMLLVDTDDDFSTGATQHVLTANGSNLEATVDFTTGQFFTLANTPPPIIPPGGVGDDLYLWLKADAGITVTDGSGVPQWLDQSQNGRDAAQISTATRPTFRDQAATHINGNPAIEFNGSNTKLSLPAGSFPIGPSNYTAYIVGVPDLIQTMALVSSGGTSTIQDSGIALGIKGNEGPLHTWTDNGFDGSPSFVANQPFVLTSAYDNKRESFVDGLTRGTKAGTGKNFISAINYIGAEQTGTSRFWDGRITEIIYYDVHHDATTRLQVESYLAIKYGITLDQSVNYIDSTTGIIWDTTMNTGYHSDIAGVGRDDGGTLNQKQSKSSNSDALVTMGAGDTIAASNAANTTILTDQAFMMWGNNDGSIVSWTTTGAPASRQLLPRSWKIVERGTIGSVRIAVPDNASAANATLPIEHTTVYLLVDADGDFSSGATEVAMTLNANVWETTYDFSHGEYYTFATEVQASCLLTDRIFTVNTLKQLYSWETLADMQNDTGINYGVVSSGVSGWDYVAFAFDDKIYTISPSREMYVWNTISDVRNNIGTSLGTVSSSVDGSDHLAFTFNDKIYTIDASQQLYEWGSIADIQNNTGTNLGVVSSGVSGYDYTAFTFNQKIYTVSLSRELYEWNSVTDIINDTGTSLGILGSGVSGFDHLSLGICGTFNVPPNAVDDHYHMLEDTVLTISASGVLTNDTDIDLDPLTSVLNTTVNSGSLTFNTDGSLNYAPTLNFTGIVTFSYNAHDGSILSLTPATVTITVLADTDGDGVANTIDIDSDNDGILNTIEGAPTQDTDSDTIPDYLDIDSDNDGLPDILEAQTTLGYQLPSNVDTNGNGWDNRWDSADGGTPPPLVNFDSLIDALPDYLDPDSDGDMLPDLFENGMAVAPTKVDSDADGLDDAFEGVNKLDDNRPGDEFIIPIVDLPDFDGDANTGGDVDYRDVDPVPSDLDGDTIPDEADIDDDNDGVPDIAEGLGLRSFISPDLDLDGVPNYFDLDSDNNGIPDTIEAGFPDANIDGIHDGWDEPTPDANQNGLLDSLEGGVTLLNRDGDIVPDYLDLDNFNWGIPDTILYGFPDENMNGQHDGWLRPNPDANGNGWLDSMEPSSGRAASALLLLDPDQDGIFSPLDMDYDGDGVPTQLEIGFPDTDGNGEHDGWSVANPDTNNNGYLDALEGALGGTPLQPRNSDGDLRLDMHDIDDDNDGILTIVEGQPLMTYKAPSGADADSDGIDNSYDPDFAGSVTLPSVDTDGDTKPDYLDRDSNNDYLPDAFGNGITHERLGADDDLDGLDNAFEHGTLDDGYIADDGVTDPLAALPDADGNGVPDLLDSEPVPLNDDGDSIPNLVEPTGDRDGDAIVDSADYEPTGYFYEETTGRIIPGGSIAVTTDAAGGSITVHENGADGFYRFSTNQKPGTYTIMVTPPRGFALSNTCAPQPTLDPEQGARVELLGAAQLGTTSRQISNTTCAANPYYLTITFEPDDPILLSNNIPLRSTTDYGDLPATYGATLFFDDGARHEIGSLYLGATVDAEADGRISIDSSADPSDDGVQIANATPWIAGTTQTLSVTVTGGSGHLVGWFDWDRNNVFDVLTETVDFGVLSAGTQTVTLTVHANFDPLQTTPLVSRFRLFNISPRTVLMNALFGYAANGEVEDYAWHVPTPRRLLPIIIYTPTGTR